MATLLKLKDKYYARIRYTLDGKCKDKLIGLGTAQAAKANRLFTKIESREILFRRDDIRLDEIQNIIYTSIETLTDQYIDNLRSREINEKTIGIYKLALNDFKEVYQDCDIDTVNLVYFRDYVRSNHSNPHTANIRIRTINAFLNYLYKSKKLKSQPDKIEQFKTPDKSPKYFSNRELVLIFNACKRKNPELYYRAFLHLNTGIRLREIDKAGLRGNLIEIYDPCKNGKPAVDTTSIYANFDSELLYQDFGHKRLVIKDIQNALLRNYSLNAVTVAKSKASRVEKSNFEFAYN